MSIISKRKLRIDSDQQELFQISEHRKQINDKTKKQLAETKLKSKVSSKQKEPGRKGHYRPSKMSDSFMPSAPTLHETTQKKEKSETMGIQLPTHIFDIEAEDEEYYVEETRALDEPFQLQEIETEIDETRETTNVTAGLDQQELMDYMRKNQKVNRLMVSIIVALIVIVAVVVVVFLVMNLRRAGQTSPLGGV